jgi:hypothetical protein
MRDDLKQHNVLIKPLTNLERLDILSIQFLINLPPVLEHITRGLSRWLVEKQISLERVKIGIIWTPEAKYFFRPTRDLVPPCHVLDYSHAFVKYLLRLSNYVCKLYHISICQSNCSVLALEVK